MCVVFSVRPEAGAPGRCWTFRYTSQRCWTFRISAYHPFSHPFPAQSSNAARLSRAFCTLTSASFRLVSGIEVQSKIISSFALGMLKPKKRGHSSKHSWSFCYMFIPSFDRCQNKVQADDKVIQRSGMPLFWEVFFVSFGSGMPLCMVWNARCVESAGSNKRLILQWKSIVLALSGAASTFFRYLDKGQTKTFQSCSEGSSRFVKRANSSNQVKSNTTLICIAYFSINFISLQHWHHTHKCIYDLKSSLGSFW